MNSIAVLYFAQQGTDPIHGIAVSTISDTFSTSDSPIYSVVNQDIIIA